MLDHMMDWYDMTEEERRLRDLAREVARREIAPRAAKHDEEGTFVRDSIEALAEAGLLGVSIPKEYGGLGGTALAATMALEAISAACGSTGAAYLFHLNLCHMIRNSGPERVRRKYLPQLAKDRLGAFAINERVRLFRDPFETFLEERGDHFVVNGEKPFSTSAGEADVTIIQVQRKDVKTVFPLLAQEYVLVEKGFSGYSAELYDPLGLRGGSNGKVRLEDVKVPKENWLGEQPGAMLRSVVVKGQSILGPNVVATGIAGAATEEAVRSARRQGTPQWQSNMLAEMTSRLNALRLYNYYGARVVPLAREGKLGTEMSLAHMEPQLLGGIDGPWICDRAMEVMGGASYMRKSPVQRYYRDARACAYLAFAMEHRRGFCADVLYAREIVAEQPKTMPWDPDASYSFFMASSAALGKFPAAAQEHVRARLSRQKYEEVARSQGSEEVSLEIYLNHLNEFARTAAERAPAPGGGDEVLRDGPAKR